MRDNDDFPNDWIEWSIAVGLMIIIGLCWLVIVT